MYTSGEVMLLRVPMMLFSAISHSPFGNYTSAHISKDGCTWHAADTLWRTWDTVFTWRSHVGGLNLQPVDLFRDWGKYKPGRKGHRTVGRVRPVLTPMWSQQDKNETNDNAKGRRKKPEQREEEEGGNSLSSRRGSCNTGCTYLLLLILICGANKLAKL